MRQHLRLARLPAARRRRAAVRLAQRVLHDNRGGEILEYAMIAGLLVVGSIGAITCVGTKVLARWNSLNNNF